MLATCMDHGLFHGIDDELALAVELPRTTNRGVIHYPEIETWIITDENSTATLTGYDWEYLVGGHASGGTLSLYYHMKVGLLLCAGMGLYTLKERNNMQLPVSSTLHESLALRLEVVQNGDSYSSLYDDEAESYWKGTCCTVKGVLKNKDHHSL
ncbi:MAG: hypothetical protein WCS35_10675, partial [Sphaerochaeta sp.]